MSAKKSTGAKNNMNKALAKIIINCYGIAFIAAGVAAFFLHSKIVVGALIFIVIGAALLRRKVFGVYGVLFLAFVLAGVGLMLAGIALNDILHRIYKFNMLLIGLVPTVLSFLTFYFFTRHEVAENFGLPKITILEKIDKKALVDAGRFLLVSFIILGLALLVCYLVAARMTR